MGRSLQLSRGGSGRLVASIIASALVVVAISVARAAFT
jgi:hypothetical protein